MEPKTIGRYEVLETLARGGMGVIYKARDPLIDRVVAIKTLGFGLSKFEAEAFEKSFAREAQSAGRLNHPNIVTIHDMGHANDGAYIAMEFLEGESLRDVIDSGVVLPPARVAHLAAQVADGLACAHRNDVVHCDIKPANIIVLPNGTVKITDFGIAKLPTGSRTFTGNILGSPRYISPEQIVGRPVDARSDLFSLGAVLYEMLTGVPPFAGDAVDEILHQVINDQPTPPSQRHHAIPASFDAIVARALAKHPDDRYQSADAIAADLRRLAADEEADPARGQDLIERAVIKSRGKDPTIAIAGLPGMPSPGPRPAPTGPRIPLEELLGPETDPPAGAESAAPEEGAQRAAERPAADEAAGVVAAAGIAALASADARMADGAGAAAEPSDTGERLADVEPAFAPISRSAPDVGAGDEPADRGQPARSRAPLFVVAAVALAAVVAWIAWPGARAPEAVPDRTAAAGRVVGAERAVPAASTLPTSPAPASPAVAPASPGTATTPGAFTGTVPPRDDAKPSTVTRSGVDAANADAAKSPPTAVAAGATPPPPAKPAAPPSTATRAGPAVATPARPAAPAAAAAASGRVGLAVSPWGEVYVDGRRRGVSPPLTELRLPPGRYTIEIRNSTFAPHAETVEVGAEGTVRVRHKFQ